MVMLYLFNLRVVGVSTRSARFNGDDVGSIAISLQNQTNMVDTSVECGSTASEVVLICRSRNRDLKVDSVVNSKRNGLNTSAVSDSVKAGRGGVSNLAQQFTGEVTICSKSICAATCSGEAPLAADASLTASRAVLMLV